MTLQELEAQNKALQAQLDVAVKAVIPPVEVDESGLKKNHDKLLDEKKKMQIKLDKIEAAAKLKETDSLKEQSKFKELWEKAEKEKAETMKAMAAVTQKQNITQAAAAAGMDIKFLPMLNNVKFDEQGNVEDVEDYFKGIRESFPMFFGDQKPVVPASDTGKPKILGLSGQKFAKEQFNNPEFFSKNKDAMMAAFAAGEIKD